MKRLVYRFVVLLGICLFSYVMFPGIGWASANGETKRFLKFEIRESSVPSGEIEVSGPITIEEAGRKIFSQNNVSYSYSYFYPGSIRYFSFIDGKNFDWCVHGESLVAYLPHLPKNSYPQIYRPNKNLIALNSLLSPERDKLVWENCLNFPFDL